MPNYIVETKQVVKKRYMVSCAANETITLDTLKNACVLTVDAREERINRSTIMKIGLVANNELKTPEEKEDFSRMLPTIIKQHAIALRDHIQSYGFAAEGDIAVAYSPKDFNIEILCDSDHFIDIVKKILPYDKWMSCSVTYRLKTNVL